MRFPRQECWSALPFLSPGNLPILETECGCPALQADSWLSESLGKPRGVFLGTLQIAAPSHSCPCLPPSAWGSGSGVHLFSSSTSCNHVVHPSQFWNTLLSTSYPCGSAVLQHVHPQACHFNVLLNPLFSELAHFLSQQVCLSPIRWSLL